MNSLRQATLHSLLCSMRDRPLTGLEIRAARTAKRAIATGRMGRSKYLRHPKNEYTVSIRNPLIPPPHTT